MPFCFRVSGSRRGGFDKAATSLIGSSAAPPVIRTRFPQLPLAKGLSTLFPFVVTASIKISPRAVEQIITGCQVGATLRVAGRFPIQIILSLQCKVAVEVYLGRDL